VNLPIGTFTFSFFGPLSATGTIDANGNILITGPYQDDIIKQLQTMAAFTPDNANNKPAALVVNGVGIAQGTPDDVRWVIAIDPNTFTITLNKPLDPNKFPGIHTYTFT
jgi:hypothetical protein